LEDLVERGLDRKRRYLVVIDRSTVLRAAEEHVFGEQVEIQLPDSQAAECEGELIANFHAGHEDVNRARVSLPRNDIE
jgi:hypothetical protein